MKLTDEQFKALAPYEKHFHTIVEHNWSRHPGTAALDLINDIYSQVVGSKQHLNKGCSFCIMELLRIMGNIYLADLAEREKMKVDVKESLTTEPVKVEVKTKRGGKRSRKE